MSLIEHLVLLEKGVILLLQTTRLLLVSSTFTYNGGSHAVGAILGIAHTMNSDETLKLRVNDNAVLAGTYKRKLGPHAFIASTSINMKNGEFLNKDPQLLGFGFEFNF